jgi:SAM-dependent methyltransferase
MGTVPRIKAAVPARYKQAARRVSLRVAAVGNAGTRYSCPCCEGSFRRLARLHGLRDQCPRCGALMRDRALVLYLRDLLHVGRKSADVLEVGPGPATTSWLSSLRAVRYVAVDLDSPLAPLHADITKLPIPDDSFDLVLCLHVLEHVPDDRRAIRELFRVLRPGGTAVIQVPPSELETTLEDPTVTTPADRERVFGQYDHVRICGADYSERIEEVGFQVTREDFVERLDAEARAQFALRVGEPFYQCAKP